MAAFEFSAEEVRRLSELSPHRWQKIRDTVVEKPPYRLDKRQLALQEAHAVLRSLHLRVWLTGGSLLGAVRNNDFIPWDDDTDMDMMAEELSPAMYQLKEQLLEAGFIVRLTNDPVFPKLSFFKYGQKLSLGGLKDEGEFRTRPHYKCPARFFTDREQIIFKGVSFLKPSPADQYLTHLYGDWRTPKKGDTNEEVYTANYLRAGKRFMTLRAYRSKIEKWYRSLKIKV